MPSMNVNAYSLYQNWLRICTILVCRCRIHEGTDQPDVCDKCQTQPCLLGYCQVCNALVSTSEDDYSASVCFTKKHYKHINLPVAVRKEKMRTCCEALIGGTSAPTGQQPAASTSWGTDQQPAAKVRKVAAASWGRAPVVQAPQVTLPSSLDFLDEDLTAITSGGAARFPLLPDAEKRAARLEVMMRLQGLFEEEHGVELDAGANSLKIVWTYADGKNTCSKRHDF